MKMKTQRHNNLQPYISKMFKGLNTPDSMRSESTKIDTDKKASIGVFRPWSWFIELVKGCNMSCGFCVTRLFPKGEVLSMTLETWKQTFDIIAKVSPICRIDMANAGEPTLNPNLLEFFRYAKKTCPTVQLLMYTNGATLIQGKITYKDIFDAGLHMVFVDMYAPKERYIKLAQDSGYEWIDGDDKKPDDINIFAYQDDPDIHRIMLMPNPGNQKRHKAQWQTWLNNLDWPAADKFGIKPVTEPLKRRCDQPFKYPNIFYDGSYSLCCQDAMREVAGKLGNVSSGVGGFMKYWFGEYMQDARQRLDNKDRASHPLCKRCKLCGGRCDVPMWKPELLKNYWDGERWNGQGTSPITSKLPPPR